MISKFSPHLEVLPPEQKQLWPEMSAARRLGFVLYGGTAIALQLGHRQSMDFDFFSDLPITRAKLFPALPFLKHSTALQDRIDTLSFLVALPPPNNISVKVSFFGGIDHGRVGEPRRTDDGILEVASLDDLMATKLKTVLQRVEAKDYRDVAAMVKAGVDLSRGLASAACMYGKANFQPSECLKALVYFEGGDLDDLPSDEKRTLIQAVSRVRDLPATRVVSKSLALP